jgi:magnesium chelatase family protein
VELLNLSNLAESRQEESSAAIAARVAKARAVQAARFAGTDIFTNAAMGSRHINQFCMLSEECRKTLEKILERMGLSARAYTRILKVARTIADLAGEPDILPPHLLEAAGFRFLDRRRVLE